MWDGGGLFSAWEGFGVFNANRNILVKGSQREGCEIFSCPLQNKRMEKPRLAMTLIYYSVQLGAIFRKCSSEKNVADINLRTCI